MYCSFYRRVIPMRKNMTYEAAMKRLEEIVTALESGELPLDKSLKLYEEATELSAFCKKYLDYAVGKGNHGEYIQQIHINLCRYRKCALPYGCAGSRQSG